MECWQCPRCQYDYSCPSSGVMTVYKARRAKRRFVVRTDRRTVASRKCGETATATATTHLTCSITRLSASLTRPRSCPLAPVSLARSYVQSTRNRSQHLVNIGIIIYTLSRGRNTYIIYNNGSNNFLGHWHTSPDLCPNHSIPVSKFNIQIVSICSLYHLEHFPKQKS